MSKRKLRQIEADESGLRVDAFLAAKLEDLSRSRIQQLIQKGRVRVNGRSVKSSYRLIGNETIQVEDLPPQAPDILPENMPLAILFQDESLIVLDKPSGLVVHPGAGRSTQTLVNGLLHFFPELREIPGSRERPGIVHRLDKETSGVLVVARTKEACEELQRQFKARQVEKRYLGLVWGRFRQTQGVISWPLGRHPRRRERISIKADKTREAETRYRLLRPFKDFSYLEIQPRTGRTHQIRVHMAASGHPLVGDTRYGRRGGKGPSPRLFLHAHILGFRHPRSRLPVLFSSPLPTTLQKVLDDLGS